MLPPQSSLRTHSIEDGAAARLFSASLAPWHCCMALLVVVTSVPPLVLAGVVDAELGDHHEVAHFRQPMAVSIYLVLPYNALGAWVSAMILLQLGLCYFLAHRSWRTALAVMAVQCANCIGAVGLKSSGISRSVQLLLERPVSFWNPLLLEKLLSEGGRNNITASDRKSGFVIVEDSPVRAGRLTEGTITISDGHILRGKAKPEVDKHGSATVTLLRKVTLDLDHRVKRRRDVLAPLVLDWAFASSNGSKSRPRVIVVQTAGAGSYHELLKESRVANEKYAAIRGYDYLSVLGVVSGSLEYQSTYNKPFILEMVLKMARYDVMLYMDADAAIERPSWQAHEILQQKFLLAAHSGGDGAWNINIGIVVYNLTHPLMPMLSELWMRHAGQDAVRALSWAGSIDDQDALHSIVRQFLSPAQQVELIEKRGTMPVKHILRPNPTDWTGATASARTVAMKNHVKGIRWPTLVKFGLDNTDHEV